MKQHPLSSAFPSMASDEFEALKDSITNIGVQDPITLYQGMVIDGWHRFTAANEVGAECPTVELGDVDPVDFVRAKNKNRRHVTAGAWALVEVSLSAWRNSGRVASTGHRVPGSTNAEMAERAGVSERTIKQAKVVQEKAAPKVKEAVKTGEISVKRAAEIAQLPAKEQAKAIKAPKPVKVEPEDVEYFGPSQEEMDAAVEEAKQDVEALTRLLEADDKLAALASENAQLRAELAVVKVSRDGYMNRSNELIDRVKWLKRKLAKAEAANV
ncbi:ParB/RepB/Spo0J family partition protein [Variovorax sp. N23]|uniref:ParB/RepB/Spo0J family partition protein n=1 Tax=Variovorax sp. N23 TaxID=2980555 RepID=UPI0021C9D9D5|nr:ParB/RepB/Spo0J family partition protein [Variovorax sp. N23]MCU4119332.1 ParB/RepB/Spo0J family partition protein [Variovorax sp. N23]